MKIICDWENCKEPGFYKAPVEKDNSKKYRLLCLEHIKIFNKNWNYVTIIFDKWNIEISQARSYLIGIKFYFSSQVISFFCKFNSFDKIDTYVIFYISTTNRKNEYYIFAS